MKKALAVILALMMVLALAACGSEAAAPAAAPAASSGDAAPAQDLSDQVYILCSTSVNDALYLNHDFRTFEEWGKRMGVTTKIIGPTEYDDVKLADIVEEAIAQKPAGLLVNGVSDVLAAVVNKAIAEGINTVLYDGDVECDRLGWVGTDWYNLGWQEGKVICDAINGKGKVAFINIVGNPNMELGREGFEAYIARYPDVELVGVYDYEGNAEKSAEIIASVYSAYPDIAGFAALGYPAGLGMGPAINELGLAGKVAVVTTDWEAPHLQFVKDGVYTALLGQKREDFTYYGATMLFEAYNHHITWGVDGVVLNSVPYAIDVGTIVIDSSNIDQFYR
ncbi:MAG: substrate-binding domain-containing protein [Oscillospiraceae bacterium]|nr:substrate-binding domain-containing protein [Oscillospiraceae bacterium]